MTTVDREVALDRLRYVIRAMVEHGEIVPCLNEARGYLWISDNHDEQVAAALGCGDCPALEECRHYVTTNPEPYCVWAGLVNGKDVAA